MARRSRGPLLGALLLGALVPSCAADRLGGACAEDADCPEGEACVLDLKTGADGEVRPETYCSRSCTSNRDCSPARACRSGSLGEGSPTERYCIDRVRECGATDPRNGLDDDCDGVTDPPSAPPVTGCRDDGVCGAWVCRAPPGEAETVCAPPEPGARADFAPCAEDAACRNGLCEAGLCSPMCRAVSGTPTSETCVPVNVDGRMRLTSCARAIGPEARPEHNLCHLDCGQGQGCPDGTACVWRDTVGAADDRHFFVCSVLDPGRKALGAPCAANTPEEDRTCQYGLCFGLRCTRRCAGPGSDCSDVGAGFVCQERVLRYGLREFPEFICVEESGG
jgi:hypothetical protein